MPRYRTIYVVGVIFYSVSDHRHEDMQHLVLDVVMHQQRMLAMFYESLIVAMYIYVKLDCSQCCLRE